MPRAPAEGPGRAGDTVHRAGRGTGEDEAVLGLMASDVGRAQAQVVRRLHAGRARGAAPDHGQDRADAAEAPHPAHACRPLRALARHAPDRARVDAHARRARPSCTGGGGRLRLRPLILILDISGSMADYSRNLLQFAHSASRAASRVEVFCFGTRLTRVTGALDSRRPDEALRRAAQAAFDWDGGTRIGDSPGRLRPGLGPARSVPRRRRRDLLGRSRPRRSCRAGGRHGTAVPAQPPGGLDEPAQGRQPRTSGRARWG